MRNAFQPFNVWCEHCKAHIGMGVRYNAEKKRVGEYFSTPIYEFRMKCHLCSGWMTIRTDPKNTTYECVSGVRRKVEEYVAAPETTGQIRLDGEEVIERLSTDPFYKLEHGQADRKRASTALSVVDTMLAVNRRQWADPYERSRVLRKRLRDEKSQQREEDTNGLLVAEKFSLTGPVLPETKQDQLEALRTQFSATAAHSNGGLVQRQPRSEIAGIFDSLSRNKSTTRTLGDELKRRRIEQQLSANNRIKIDGLLIKRK